MILFHIIQSIVIIIALYKLSNEGGLKKKTIIIHDKVRHDRKVNVNMLNNFTLSLQKTPEKNSFNFSFIPILKIKYPLYLYWFNEVI